MPRNTSTKNQNRPVISRTPKRCQPCTIQSASTSSALRPSREFKSRLNARKTDTPVPGESASRLPSNGSARNSHQTTAVHINGLMTKRNEMVNSRLWKNRCKSGERTIQRYRLDHQDDGRRVDSLEETGQCTAEPGGIDQAQQEQPQQQNDVFRRAAS